MRALLFVLARLAVETDLAWSPPLVLLRPRQPRSRSSTIPRLPNRTALLPSPSRRTMPKGESRLPPSTSSSRARARVPPSLFPSSASLVASSHLSLSFGYHLNAASCLLLTTTSSPPALRDRSRIARVSRSLRARTRRAGLTSISVKLRAEGKASGLTRAHSRPFALLDPKREPRILRSPPSTPLSPGPLSKDHASLCLSRADIQARLPRAGPRGVRRAVSSSSCGLAPDAHPRTQPRWVPEAP